MGLIYLDSCLLIYTIENHPVYGARVLKALAREKPGRFAISPLTSLECLVQPIRSGDVVLQGRYQDALANIEELPLPTPVFLQAAQLRARFNLKTPDSLHLACAQFHGCAALWTNDERLAAAGRGLVRDILR
jgi:predicted nucleic acid-binding protein